MKGHPKFSKRNIVAPRLLFTGLLFAVATRMAAQSEIRDYPIQPVPFTQVHLTDDFWQPRLQTNATVTIPYILAQCRKHGRIDNFLMASGKIKPGKMTDFPFDDTDLYKLIEGASYSLQENYNASLDKQMDTLIAIIGAAQEPDGYLYTFRSAKVEKPHEWIGARRWEKEEELSHELYNSGHLYESAVAHFEATGKKTLLNIAIRNADLLTRVFGPGKLQEYPGHQIVELGLVKMYRITRNKQYLDLAKFFLDVRGPNGEAYNQADARVTDQTHAEGHAVRAAYMYTGIADVAAITGDKQYLKTIDTIWDDVALRKLYITGGIGATGNGEAFSDAYDLPNMTAYAETCAAIANVYWNQRMFLLHGEAKYMDVLERTLYNGLLSGISLSGNRFFYPNPLASVGQHERSAWFSCACCITNMTRFLPSMPGYVYAQNENNLFVNLFVSNNATVRLRATTVKLSEQTRFPWEGDVRLVLHPAKPAVFALHLRLPGWASGQPLSGSDLYSFMDIRAEKIPVYVNGRPADYRVENGYALLSRKWKEGDEVRIVFPMETRKIKANERVKADAGRFALQRGPVVYCLEGADQKDSAVQSLVADTAAIVSAVYHPQLLNGITELSLPGYQATKDSGVSKTETRTITAIPYYSWNNRGSGEMEVWIPYRSSAARPKAIPTIASKSTVSSSVSNRLMLKALNDQYEPVDSKDQSMNYLHWWPEKNSSQWVQYDFDSAHTIAESRVYWYDDKPHGGCAVPLSWKLLYKNGTEWLPVEAIGAYGTARDQYNTVKFKPVQATAVRLVLQLPENDSSGIHEWTVE